MTERWVKGKALSDDVITADYGGGKSKSRVARTPASAGHASLAGAATV
jgi:hypothetical protein